MNILAFKNTENLSSVRERYKQKREHEEADK